MKKDADKLIEIGKEKVKKADEKIQNYLSSTILAGMFIGLGIIFSMTVASYLKETPFEKIGMGIVFPMALSIVIILKVDLFTSGVFLFGFGKMRNVLSNQKIVKALTICYFGNWIGSILISFIFVGTGSADGIVGEYMAKLAFAKMNYSAIELLSKGILCNILVCLAGWASYKMETETGKLIMIFWCLFAMIVSGFEHSIANMTTLTLGLVKNYSLEISLFGYFYNLFWVTLGNIIGGIIFVALPVNVMYKD